MVDTPQGKYTIAPMPKSHAHKPPVLVSACLAGLATRYDGGSTPCETVLELVRQGRALPVCPEQLGGLPTPREPLELRDGRVYDRDGNEFTESFRLGAEQGLKLARLAGCTTGVLKSGSPSCGAGTVHDGTFTGTKIPGNGVFAGLLLAHGIRVLTELDCAEGLTPEEA